MTRSRTASREESLVCTEPLRLQEPTIALEGEYLEMADEFRRAGDWTGWNDDIEKGTRNFEAFVGELQDYARGRNLPDGLVPCSVYWLARGKRLMGTASLRHRLTDSLLHEGGHIGYGIRPSERRKGYATQLLALMLEKARQRFIGRVLVTCDKDNVASARVIQKNGGHLEDERVSRKTGKVKQRYWIDLWDQAE